MHQAPQPPQPPQQPEQPQQQQQQASSNNNGGLSERQIGELQMAAQAAAAAQHGASGNKHASSEGSYDYAEKRQKVDESPQGQHPESSSSFYPNPNAY
jgi:hypothetical protein